MVGGEQRMEKQGTWASRTQKHSEAGYGPPVDRGVWTAKTVKQPRQQPAHPQYANYWALLTRKRHTLPHSAQPQHTNYWAPRTRKRRQQEHWPQRPTESSNPTQHAKGRTGDCPGPRKGATTRRNVTHGVQGGFRVRSLVDGAGSYSVAHTAGLLPTELTGMWGWILLRSPHQGRGSPPAPAPQSKGLVRSVHESSNSRRED